MGNHTSRHILQKKERYLRQSRVQSSNNKNFDQQYFNQSHMDLHYTAIDKILNDHFILTQSDADQVTIHIHKHTLNIAMKHHSNAVYTNRPNYQHTHKIIYTF